MFFVNVHCAERTGNSIRWHFIFIATEDRNLPMRKRVSRLWIIPGVIWLGFIWVYFIQDYVSQTSIDAKDYLFSSPTTPTFGYKTEQPNWDRQTRIVLIHGLRSNSRSWKQEPLVQLTKQLQSSQLVFVDLPWATARFFDDGGAAYCKAFLSSLNAELSRLDASFGKPEKTIVLGVSYGGFHSLIAAQSPQVDSIVAIMPVVSVDRLHELRWSSNSRCSPFGWTDALSDQTNLIIYGKYDKRVDANLTRQLILKSGVRFSRYPLKHKTTPELLDRVARFVKTDQ